MTEVREYINAQGSSPFAKWFNGLNATAAARITMALTRVELGNLSDHKSVGAGVWELRLDFGPGYRVYFGKDGDRLVILLGGGTKKRRQKNIETAKLLWKDYKKRKREEK
ncbi:MAG TPA: type II toxin-antitoxin system RelE/ParE family toxin [Nitrospirae bacterium]|nr:type II toxin-antitoxin system RelE/ParE family toxin [Nitrospirota bacterium]